MIQVKVNKYLSEAWQELSINLLGEGKRKVLIEAPMKIGKTTFSFKELNTLLRTDFETLMIFVAPTRSLLSDIQNKYDVIRVDGTNGHTSCNLRGFKPIVTTTDSLYKVVAACKKENQKFYIVFDEAHESILHYSFRKSIVSPFNFYNEELCQGLCCLSATSESIRSALDFDNIIEVEVKEKFVQAKEVNIITNFKESIDYISDLILKFANKNKVVVRINDKKKIKAIEKILSPKGLKVLTWYRDIEEIESLEEALINPKLEFNVILTTSLVDVGVEFHFDENINVINLLDHNSTLDSDIQFIGRFRNGVNSYTLVSNLKEPNEVKTISYTDIIQKLYTCAKAVLTDIKEYSELLQLKSKFQFLKIENGEYVINKFEIYEQAYKLYIQQFIKNPKELKKYLQEHKTFNAEKIKVFDGYKESEFIQELQQEAEIIKNEQKIIKEEFKNELMELTQKIVSLEEKEIEILLTKEEDLLVADDWIHKKIIELYEFYHSNDMKEYRARFYNIDEFLFDKYTLKEILLFCLDDKRYKNYCKQRKYIEYNHTYNGLIKNKEHIKLNNSQDLKMKQVFIIRNTIKKLFGKERSVRLGKGNMDKLLKELQKEKSFSKVTGKTLEKLLFLTYNIDTKNLISSTKSLKNLTI